MVHNLGTEGPDTIRQTLFALANGRLSRKNDGTGDSAVTRLGVCDKFVGMAEAMSLVEAKYL